MRVLQQGARNLKGSQKIAGTSDEATARWRLSKMARANPRSARACTLRVESKTTNPRRTTSGLRAASYCNGAAKCPTAHTASTDPRCRCTQRSGRHMGVRAQYERQAGRQRTEPGTHRPYSDRLRRVQAGRSCISSVHSHHRIHLARSLLCPVHHLPHSYRRLIDRCRCISLPATRTHRRCNIDLQRSTLHSTRRSFITAHSSSFNSSAFRFRR